MNEKPVISISLKRRKRLRIHKITMKLLNNPEYILILINPSEKIIVIKPSDYTDHLALSVKNNTDRKKHDTEVYSDGLFNQLLLVNPNWKQGKSYRIFGEHIPDQNIVVFRMAESEEIDVNN